MPWNTRRFRPTSSAKSQHAECRHAQIDAKAVCPIRTAFLAAAFRRRELQKKPDRTLGMQSTQMQKSARLLESHADVIHKNTDVQGIHKLVNAARIGNQTMRVELTVRDYAIKNQERTVIRLIDSIDVEVVDSGAASTGRIDNAGAEATLPLESQKPPSAAHPAEPRGLQAEAPRAVILSRLLLGKVPFLRSDKRG